MLRTSDSIDSPLHAPLNTTTHKCKCNRATSHSDHVRPLSPRAFKFIAPAQSHHRHLCRSSRACSYSCMERAYMYWCLPMIVAPWGHITKISGNEVGSDQTPPRFRYGVAADFQGNAHSTCSYGEAVWPIWIRKRNIQTKATIGSSFDCK